MPSTSESVRFLEDQHFEFHALTTMAACRIQIFKHPVGGTIVVATQSTRAEKTCLVNAQRLRLRAVRRLRAHGWSYDRIAAATDLSRGRVAQLSNDPRKA